MKIIQLISCLLLTCFVKDQEAKLMFPVGHTSNVTTAMFSPDGKKIVTASEDFTAKVWDAVTGVTTCRFKRAYLFGLYSFF